MRWGRILLCVSFLTFVLTVWHQEQAKAGTDIVDRFDHYETGFPLEGRHALLSCESCHAKAVFKGAPRTCDGCHNNVFAEGKPSRHIPTSRPCAACHTVQEWRLSRFDHTDVVGGCVRCHNNYLAPGKTPNHPVTSNVCEDCHGTVHWGLLLPTYVEQRRLGAVP